MVVQLTVVRPSGKNPEAWSQLTIGAGSTMSVAVASGRVTLAPPVVSPSTVKLAGTVRFGGGILKKCVTSQAVYPLSEQHGLKARERRYTAHEEGKHWE